ncbi:DegT/DnrJ/EryC1/StrS family aminotransferase [Nibrella viscosa]|uniref:DegT/DnrJ/EryC1/StrS family aminotransferase n=1 Tax=Nibrella viscosa TaxID=1084524 RepID=A0ABP8K404_9BACT
MNIASIRMVDLHGQYQRLKADIDAAIQQCLDQTDFINGAYVRQFQRDLATYLQAEQVITCGNGTDALQLAFMALDLQPGDEVIVPAFNYVATAEVLTLLGLTPVWADVDPDTFTLTAGTAEKALSNRTKAIVPVHLFGQCAEMEPLLHLANAHNLYVIEDIAQAIGSRYTGARYNHQMAGTLGHVGCLSFFPSKNLGCYGDGGALCTNHPELADRLQMIANHGQRVKYRHELVGVNSRLDTLQAAVLTVKLRHLEEFNQHRQLAASRYDEILGAIPGIRIPGRAGYSTHVFHQYTIRVADHKRDGLQAYLHEHNIPSMVYYPMAMHQQPAYARRQYPDGSFPVAEMLSRQVLSLPMHTELTQREQDYIGSVIADYMARQQ